MVVGGISWASWLDVISCKGLAFDCRRAGHTDGSLTRNTRKRRKERGMFLQALRFLFAGRNFLGTAAREASAAKRTLLRNNKKNNPRFFRYLRVFRVKLPSL